MSESHADHDDDDDMIGVPRGLANTNSDTETDDGDEENNNVNDEDDTDTASSSPVYVAPGSSKREQEEVIPTEDDSDDDDIAEDEEEYPLPVINTATTEEVLGISSDSDTGGTAEDTLGAEEADTRSSSPMRLGSPQPGPSGGHQSGQPPGPSTSGVVTSSNLGSGVVRSSRGKMLPWRDPDYPDDELDAVLGLPEGEFVLSPSDDVASPDRDCDPRKTVEEGGKSKQLKSPPDSKKAKMQTMVKRRKETGVKRALKSKIENETEPEIELAVGGGVKKQKVESDVKVVTPMNILPTPVTRKLFVVNPENGLKKRSSFSDDQELYDIVETGRKLLGIPKLCPIQVLNISDKVILGNCDMSRNIKDFPGLTFGIFIRVIPQIVFRQTKGPNKMFACDQCSKTYEKKNSLTEHIAAIHGEGFPCDCGETHPYRNARSRCKRKRKKQIK